MSVASDNVDSSKEPECDAVVIFSAGWNPTLAREIHDAGEFLGHRTFKWLKLQPVSEFALQGICVYLSQKNIGYFIHHKIEDFRQQVVVRGLPIDTCVGSISKELLAKGYPVVSVCRLTHIANKKPMPLFRVTLREDTASILNAFSSGGVILDYNVSIEPYKRPKRPLRCINCQEFGHYARDCHFPSKCGRCSQGHRTSECMSTSATSCPRCTGQHPASYKGCSLYPRIKPKKQRAEELRISLAEWLNELL